MAFDTSNKNLMDMLRVRYGIAGRSKPIEDAVALLMQAAPTDLTVLITGETGTGKEVFANALHGLSLRKKMPFVSVNCGAIPETLLESELFGHERGAFTGANESRVGFFESAHKGTIFLDEIGEMPFSTQVKLLRVLESGEFSKLGSPAIKKIDVRVIAATNRNLENSVQKGTFRQDLFFRLNSVHIKLPSLREHTEDIPLMIDYFSEKVAEKIGVEFTGISPDAISILKSLPWQGNVRELRNMIESIITLEKGAYIDAELIRKYIPPALPAYNFTPQEKEQSLVQVSRTTESGNMELSLIFRTLLELRTDMAEIKSKMDSISAEVTEIKYAAATASHEDKDSFYGVQELPTADELIESLEDLNLGELERKMINHALKKYGGNRRLAAESLGISERTLYRKITEMGA